MKTKSERVLQILKDNTDNVFSRKSLRDTFNSLYPDKLSSASINKILETTVKRHCLRTPKQASNGFLYTYSNHKLLEEVFDNYLLPYDFSNKPLLIALMQCTKFEYLPNRGSATEDDVLFSQVIGFGMGDGHLSRDKNYFILFFFFLEQDALSFTQKYTRLLCRFSITLAAGCFRVTGSRKQESCLPAGNRDAYRKQGQAIISRPRLDLSWPRGGQAGVLRGIFGAEGSKPFKNRWRIQFVLSKEKQFLQNLLEFLNQIRCMLIGFGIASTNIQVRTQPGRSFHGRFYITGREAVLLFYAEIGYAFASEKQEALEAIVTRFKSACLSPSPCAVIR